MKIFNSFFILALFLLTSCGDIQDRLQDTLDNIEEIDGHSSAPEPIKNPPYNILSKSKENLKLEMDKYPDCYKPLPSTGFKCDSSATRGGNIFCVLPYYYTAKPRYTKVDHHGHQVQCNEAYLRFDKAEIDLGGGQIQPLFYEDVSPYNNEIDYGCANYVGSPEGPVGRQHWRGNFLYKSLANKKSVVLKLYLDNKINCLKIK